MLVAAHAASAGGRVDPAAGHMGRGRELGALEPAARRHRAAARRRESPGLPIGQDRPGRPAALQGWEDCTWTSRGRATGKTTSRAIPAILEAPGRCASPPRTSATSSTRPAARGRPRARCGCSTRRSSIDEPPTLVVEPAQLRHRRGQGGRSSPTTSPPPTGTPSARTDAFFDPKGQKVVAGLLLAAALAERTITRSTCGSPTRATTSPSASCATTATSCRPTRSRPRSTRPRSSAPASTAPRRRSLAFLTNRSAPGLGHARPAAAIEFDPHEFVRGTGTLYSLSKEGKGSAGALVAALTVAVIEAAEELAKSAPGGRLPVPHGRRARRGGQRLPLAGAAEPLLATTAPAASC